MSEPLDKIIAQIEACMPETPDRAAAALALARTIVEELARPTAAMIDAGTPLDRNHTSTETYDLAFQQAEATWRAMLRVVLA